MKTVVCSIAAKNYLALAKTLGDSLIAHHSDIAFRTLVVDASELPPPPVLPDWMTADAPTDFLSVPDFRAMAFKYDVTELSTALNPF